MSTYSEFKANVRAYISRSEEDDSTGAKAIAEWVYGYLWRDTLNDGDAARQYFENYQRLRRKRAGLAFTGNLAAVQAAVKAHMGLGSTDDRFKEAVRYYAQARIQEDYDQRPADYATWRRKLIDLAGHNPSITATALRDAIKIRLPRETNRNGIDAYLLAVCQDAIAELDGVNAFIDGQVELAKNDMEGLAGYVDDQIDQAIREIQRNSGMEKFQKIHYIRYKEADVTVSGMGVYADWPQGEILEVWLMLAEAGNTDDIQCNRRYRARQVPYDNRHSAIINGPGMNSQLVAVYTVDPTQKIFYFWPAVKDNEREIEIVYRQVGVYADTDTLPMTEVEEELAKQFAAEYVTTRLHDGRDRQVADASARAAAKAIYTLRTEARKTATVALPSSER